MLMEEVFFFFLVFVIIRFVGLYIFSKEFNPPVEILKNMISTSFFKSYLDDVF